MTIVLDSNSGHYGHGIFCDEMGVERLQWQLFDFKTGRLMLHIYSLRLRDQFTLTTCGTGDGEFVVERQ